MKNITHAYYEAGRNENSRKKSISDVGAFVRENISGSWRAVHEFDEEDLMYRVGELLRREKERQKKPTSTSAS